MRALLTRAEATVLGWSDENLNRYSSNGNGKMNERWVLIWGRIKMILRQNQNNSLLLSKEEELLADTGRTKEELKSVKPDRTELAILE